MQKAKSPNDGVFLKKFNDNLNSFFLFIQMTKIFDDFRKRLPIFDYDRQNKTTPSAIDNHPMWNVLRKYTVFFRPNISDGSSIVLFAIVSSIKTNSIRMKLSSK